MGSVLLGLSSEEPKGATSLPAGGQQPKVLRPGHVATAGTARRRLRVISANELPSFHPVTLQLPRQRSVFARPQPLTVCIQPADEGDTASGMDFSVVDTETSQDCIYAPRLPAPCMPGFYLFFPLPSHPRRLVHIACKLWSTPRFWATQPTAEPRLLHCPKARWVGCAYRRKRLGLHRGCTDGTGFSLHRGCTDGTGFRLSLEPWLC